MTTFTVSFDPMLPCGGGTSPPDQPDWSRIYAITEGLEYDMTYHVGGQAFGYYPTDVVGLLNDLIGAKEALDRGQDGVISMSGYTILLAEGSGASLVFSEPSPSKWRCEVQATVVREALDQALRDVWSFVISLDQPSSTWGRALPQISLPVEPECAAFESRSLTVRNLRADRSPGFRASLTLSSA